MTTHFKKILPFFIIFLIRPLVAVDFQSSRLPIIIIDTRGQEIQDEPKITALMKIIDNGPGQENFPNDPATDYDGLIGIEYRGDSSQQFPKKQFGVETRDSDGADLDVSLLGMPEESDWVLYAPYSDKSLLRNVLAYQIARSMGRYASRTRFCEIILNGEYWGVYVFEEKIKRDKNRVAIKKLESDEISGIDLTGGYMLKVDKFAGSELDGWWSEFPVYFPYSDGHVFYQYHYPKPSNIQPAQKGFIQQYMVNFQRMMLAENYESEFSTWMDVNSFVDYLLVNEISRNVDAYRLSAFFYRDRQDVDSRLHMGPVWDFNLAFGNADYYDAFSIEGWQIEFFMYDPYFNSGGDFFLMPFWWGKLWDSSVFRQAVAVRWFDLRKTVLSTDSLMACIDRRVAELDGAQQRNFERWPVLGKYVWPNAFVGENYTDEINYLKNWLEPRLEWMDSDLVHDLVGVTHRPSRRQPDTFFLQPNFPNPFNSQTTIRYSLPQTADISLDILDVRGRVVATLAQGAYSAGTHAVSWDGFDNTGQSVASGVYFYRLQYDGMVQMHKLLLVK